MDFLYVISIFCFFYSVILFSLLVFWYFQWNAEMKNVKRPLIASCIFTCRDDHPQSLITSMSSIITRILEEKVEEADADPLILEGSASLPLLDVILHNLIKERKVNNEKFLDSFL